MQSGDRCDNVIENDLLLGEIGLHESEFSLQVPAIVFDRGETVNGISESYGILGKFKTSACKYLLRVQMSEHKLYETFDCGRNLDNLGKLVLPVNGGSVKREERRGPLNVRVVDLGIDVDEFVCNDWFRAGDGREREIGFREFSGSGVVRELSVNRDVGAVGEF